MDRFKKKTLPPLITEEIQLKNTMRYHLISVRMVIIKKMVDNKHWWDVEKSEPLHNAGGNVN